MRVLLIHSDYLKYEARKKALKWYADTIGFDLAYAITKINQVKKRW